MAIGGERGPRQGQRRLPRRGGLLRPGATARTSSRRGAIKVEVFAKDLNFPTAIAFQGDSQRFKVHVIESGTGLPGRCNNN
jgi:hypothetical protein